MAVREKPYVIQCTGVIAVLPAKVPPSLGFDGDRSGCGHRVHVPTLENILRDALVVAGESLGVQPSRTQRIAFGDGIEGGHDAVRNGD